MCGLALQNTELHTGLDYRGIQFVYVEQGRWRHEGYAATTPYSVRSEDPEIFRTGLDQIVRVGKELDQQPYLLHT